MSENKIKADKEYRKKTIKGKEKEVDSFNEGETFDEARYYNGEQFEVGGEEYNSSDYRKDENQPDSKSP